MEDQSPRPDTSAGYTNAEAPGSSQGPTVEDDHDGAGLTGAEPHSEKPNSGKKSGKPVMLIAAVVIGVFVLAAGYMGFGHHPKQPLQIPPAQTSQIASHGQPPAPVVAPPGATTPASHIVAPSTGSPSSGLPSSGAPQTATNAASNPLATPQQSIPLATPAQVNELLGSQAAPPSTVTAPVAPSPIAPSPVAQAQVVPAPVVPAPVAPAPIAPAPVAPSLASAPVASTSQLVTPTDGSLLTSSAVEQPSHIQPSQIQPSQIQPQANQPLAPQPPAAQPVIAQNPAGIEARVNTLESTVAAIQAGQQRILSILEDHSVSPNHGWAQARAKLSHTPHRHHVGSTRKYPHQQQENSVTLVGQTIGASPVARTSHQRRFAGAHTTPQVDAIVNHNKQPSSPVCRLASIVPGRAWVKQPDGSFVTYGVGDKAPNGANITAISPDSGVTTTSGHLECTNG